MRKLLTLLGSISLVASSASTVLACSKTTQKVNNDTQQTIAYRNESINSLKSLVLSDQYGLDPVKTNRTISVNPNAQATPNFNKPDKNVTSGLNLKGMLGKDNVPLYSWNDQLNKLLAMIKVGPVDLSSYFDDWGGVIKEIPHFLNSGDLTGLFSLIPTILEAAASYINVDIDPDSVTWIGELIKMNIRYIVKSINFDSKIEQIIDTYGKGKTTLVNVTDAGTKALENLVNLFFDRGEYQPDSQSSDEALSIFLGQEVLTPLLNKKPINSDKIKKMFTNPVFYFAHITDIIDNATTFLAAVFMQLSFYIPKMNPTPDDATHLLNGGKSFADYDKETLDYTDDGKITLSGETDPVNISWNTVVYGTLNLLTNNGLADQVDSKTGKPVLDPKTGKPVQKNSYDILKLTNILFHDDGDTKNPLLTKITYWFIDALKFTDYNVDVAVGDKNNPTEVTEQAGVHVGVIVDMKFNLKDLFQSGKKLSLASVYTRRKKLFGGLTDWSDVGDVTLDISKNGLADISDSLIEPLIGSIISGNNDAVKNNLYALIDGIKSSGGPVYVDINIGTLLNWAVPLLIDALKSTIWGKVSGILNDLLLNVWYTDGDKFYAGLKQLGLDDKTIAGIKTSIGDTFPLYEKVLSAVQNTPIGDLTKYAGIINLDTFGSILNILFIENPFQNYPGTKKQSFANTGNSSGKPAMSLIEQILATMNDKDKGKEWNYYLGYVDQANITNASDRDSKAMFVYKDGLIGQLIYQMYPQLDTNSAKVPGSLVDATYKDKTGADVKTKAVSLRKVGLVQSDAMDNLSKAMAKVADELQGDNISDIVNPLLTDDSIWKVTKATNKFFSGTKDLQYESYNLTFDTSDVRVTHRDKNGTVTVLPSKKVTYRIIFTRIDNKSTFDFKSIEKIS